MFYNFKNYNCKDVAEIYECVYNDVYMKGEHKTA
jgi:hypothetical protein